MLIPVEVEPAEDFIARAKAALADANTHVYVDTSLLMWLTAVGPSSRATFVDWASTLQDRIHVPAWSAHEYYRHHQRKTQSSEIAEKCAAVESALNDLKAHMRVYADGPIVPDQPEMSFVRDLEAVADRLSATMKLARGWDYGSAAIVVIGWMNAHALSSTEVFDSFTELKRRGTARYGHEVPPGFEDGHKRTNRFGDLIFWQDVIADAKTRKAARVVVLTRDRKKDWFFAGLEGELSPELRRLRGNWNPVPVAHPMLTLELKAKAAAELLLIDELYMGGIMWATDKQRFGRLAAVTFGMDLERLEEALAPPPGVPERAKKRQAGDVIGMIEASSLVRAAKANADRDAVSAILASLEAGPAEVEETIQSFTVDSIMAMPAADLVLLAKRLYDLALDGPSPALTLARRLLDGIDRIDALHASSIVGGMLVSAYFEGVVARNRPTGQLFQELLEWRTDTALIRIIDSLARELRRSRSPAIYFPSVSTDSIEVRIDASASNARNPVAVGQIFFGQQAVLVDPPVKADLSLSVVLEGAETATVDALVTAIGRHYGVPLDQLKVIGTDVDEARTILSTTGVDRFDLLRLPILVTDPPAPLAGEVPPAEETKTGGGDDDAEAEANPAANDMAAPAAEDADDDEFEGDDDAMIDEEDLQ